VVRVLIVDDSPVIRSFLEDVLNSDPDITVVGMAENCEVAVQKFNLLAPDVVTLDVELPDGNGLKLLSKLKCGSRAHFIMVSAMTQTGASTTIKALQEGALDFVAKPLESSDKAWLDFGNELIFKSKMPSSSGAVFPKLAEKSLASTSNSSINGLIVIGGSTGAVPIVEHILVNMTSACSPIVVGIHMPQQFTAQLAKRLNEAASIDVFEAADGMVLQKGTALIAPGERHLSIRASGSVFKCKLENGPKIGGHKPSLDVLFDSVAKAANANAIGMILTGMGRDGVSGLSSMRRAGAITACQDETSSMVYGMPKVALETGAAEHVVNVNEMVEFLLQASQGKSVRNLLTWRHTDSIR
jgi:two-component system, chemotaxis family, protein-glutamate methylesterase/glutaminase